MDIITFLFIIRIIPLSFAGFVSARNKNYLGMGICFLYLCVTSVNFLYGNPSLNAIFSTPLTLLTAWYIIRNNRRLTIIRKDKG